MANKPYHILVLGGGTAGWMTAAALANRLPRSHYRITLVESAQIATVGVGESTIPHIRQYLQALGIDEAEFLRETQATYKLGIQFRDWGNIGDCYLHPFGELGAGSQPVGFHQRWVRARRGGLTLPLDAFSVAAEAAQQGRFAPPLEDKRQLLGTYSFAYHLDAVAFARLLSRYAQTKGVERIEGTVETVYKDPATEDIQTLVMTCGRRLQADLFVDCSGFRARLMGEYEQSRFQSWQHWLPCNRAVVAPSEKSGPTHPYTRASAKPAGWQWQIPLQNRVGNGHVFSSQHMSDEQAQEILLNNLPGKPLADPRFLDFTAGCRDEQWVNNCVAIGLSAGFLEPLESTSIFLIQVGIVKLLDLMPFGPVADVARKEFNRLVGRQYEVIRNFIILHYHLTQRQDTDFWRYCKDMTPPDELSHLMRLFAQTGQVSPGQYGQWPAVCIGQGLMPEVLDRRLVAQEDGQGIQGLSELATRIAMEVGRLPNVDEYIARQVRGASMTDTGVFL